MLRLYLNRPSSIQQHWTTLIAEATRADSIYARTHGCSAPPLRFPRGTAIRAVSKPRGCVGLGRRLCQRRWRPGYRRGSSAAAVEEIEITYQWDAKEKSPGRHKVVLPLLLSIDSATFTSDHPRFLPDQEPLRGSEWYCSCEHEEACFWNWTVSREQGVC